MRILSSLALGFVLLACSGSTVTISATNRDGGPGAPDPIDPVEPTCGIQTTRADRLCLPGTAKAGVVIDAEIAGACLSCGMSSPRCVVSVRGRDIEVSLEVTSCTQRGEVGCAAVCMQPRVACQLPALSAGTYDVRLQATGLPTTSHELVVEANGTSNCKIEDAPSALDPRIYGRACTQASDCALVSTEVCSPCACSDAAIAKSDLSRYQSDLRARSSSCGWNGGVAACRQCQVREAACVNDTCVAR